jgi:DNA polymerase (family 10)
VPVHNTEIAEIFNEYADLIEIDGASQYRVRAYRTAARNISNMPRSIAEMVNNEEDLTKLPGIGKDLAGKTADIVNTGKLSQLEELKNKLPEELIDITGLAGLGPKRTGLLYQKLGITSIEQLEEAAKKNKIRELPGFAAKTEQKILQEIGRKGEVATDKKRYKLSVTEELVQSLLSYLKSVDGVKQVEIAGSYRRKKETVGDLDILVSHRTNSKVMDRFVDYEDVNRVVSKGETRSTVILRSGIQVDLRAVPEVCYGAALHYFTGSQAHNITVRKMGVKKGLKINEYGVFRGKERIAGKTEEEVYDQVDLPYIEPELRENNGEIEAAQKGQLPQLITLKDIKGDLHSHTRATDGRSSLEDMAEAAKARGYEYLAITEHSRHVTVAKGLDSKRLAQRIKEIDRVNKKLDGIVLLKGIELDILEDGTLDLPDDILKELDLVVCAVHYKFDLPMEKQTDRIIRGIDNPYFTILAHPTGRMIGEREPYQVDIERLIKAAKDKGVVLELNAQPERLDLTEISTKMAKEMGVMVAISTDAHSTNELDAMRFGINQARRGWLEATDVLNTRSIKELNKLLKKQ